MVKKIKKNTWKKALKEVQKDITKKVGLFNQMGDECLSCEMPFDKSDIEEVASWHVTVRRDPDVVNLYCPDCWKAAQETIEDFKKRVEERPSEDDTK